MGADIHVFRRRRIDGEWKDDLIIEHPDEDDPDYMIFSGEACIQGYYRDYFLFGLLASVRCSIFKDGKEYSLYDPYPQDRDSGFISINPKDFDDLKQSSLGLILKQWEDDAHSEGIFTLDDLQKYIETFKISFFTQDISFGRMDVSCTDVIETLTSFYEKCVKDWETINPSDVQILIFFDN